MSADAGSGPTSDLSRGIVVAGRPFGDDADPGRPGILGEAAEWARGRNGWLRLPLLLWFAWVLSRHLRDPDYDSLFGGLNLAIHELGHMLFAPLGDFMSVAGGTILQLVAPLAGALMFRRQRDYFGLAVVACWLSTNLFEIGRYVADARAQQLPLVSPATGDPLHDWAYMLGRLGWLRYDLALGGAVQRLAVASMLAGLGAGGWLVWRMLRSRDVDVPGPTS